jgi:hypothetical protein
VHCTLRVAGIVLSCLKLLNTSLLFPAARSKIPMWLVDTTTFELREFPSTPPPYVILSHTWGDEEVTFQELRDLLPESMVTPQAEQKAGFRKIKRCCEQARIDGLAYAWVDTCCIDKRSSAELSEAINSMFRWYSEAKLCYAHLSDVSLLHPDEAKSTIVAINSYPRPVWGFPSSRYFTRGWTLQEILAPMHVIFFDKDWGEIGTKATLLEDLVEITGIPSKALMQPRTIQRHSVADRMSWASKRETTRIEDQAYSLLGLFGINMPLLYGEGMKAFYRLQLQILSESNDHSILAWKTSTPAKGEFRDGYGVSVLAESPAMFSNDDARSIRNLVDSSVFPLPPQSPITVTNIGLSVKLPVLTLADQSRVAFLDCFSGGKRIAIHVTGDVQSNVRSRYRPHELVYSDKLLLSKPSERFYMSTKVPDFPSTPGSMQIGLFLNIRSEKHGWKSIYTTRAQPGTNESAFDTDDPRRLWSMSPLVPPPEPLRMISKTLPLVREGEWLWVYFSGIDGCSFNLIFGPKEGRVWCHGYTSRQNSLTDLDRATVAIRDMFAEDARRFDEPAWSYFRDRISYRLDSCRIMNVAIKVRSQSPGPDYRVEVVQEDVSERDETNGTQ